MLLGRLTFFIYEKGYGFIQPIDGGRDVFIHIYGWRPVVVGQKGPELAEIGLTSHPQFHVPNPGESILYELKSSGSRKRYKAMVWAFEDNWLSVEEEIRRNRSGLPPITTKKEVRTSSEVQRGVVHSFFADRHFGFILCRDHRTIFFHQYDFNEVVEGEEGPELPDDHAKHESRPTLPVPSIGDAVVFRLGTGKKGTLKALQWGWRSEWDRIKTIRTSGS